MQPRWTHKRLNRAKRNQFDNIIQHEKTAVSDYRLARSRDDSGIDFRRAGRKSGKTYFAIHVVDAQTGRSVPLVDLRTVNKLSARAVRHVRRDLGPVASL
jgi:hypothetical protein